MCKTVALIPSLVFAFTLQAKESSVVDYGQSSSSTSYDLVWSYDVQTEGAVPFAIITGVHGSNGTGTASPVGSIAVPESITDTATGNGYIVKRIGNGAFANSIGITSVTMPSTLESIGDFAFSNCTSLASVTIPEGVRSIGKRPFVNTIVTGLKLPDSLLNIDGNIAAGALFDLGNALSDSSHFLVTEDGAVYNRDKTKLYACPSRAEGSIRIPSTVTEIGADAFFGCFRLIYLNIPKSVATINDGAFNVSGTWQTSFAPESEPRLKKVFFQGPPPTAAENIYEGAPVGLTNYVSGIAWDEYRESGWCGRAIESFDEDTLTDPLPYLDADGITWHFRIRVKEMTAIIDNDGDCAVEPQDTMGALYSQKIGDDYEYEYGLKIPRSINGYTVTAIGSNALAHCSNVERIGISDTVTRIEDGAFANCRALRSIDSDDNIPFDCALGTISLPYGLNELGYHAFENLPHIQTFIIPRTLTVISGNPVAGLPWISQIEVETGNPIYTAVNNLLYNAKKTQLISIPATTGTSIIAPTVREIGDEALLGCKYLDSVILPKELMKIGDFALNGCSSLAELTIPASVTTIGSAAFSDCASLTNVTFEGREPANVAEDIFDSSELVAVFALMENGWSDIGEWKGRPLNVIPSPTKPTGTILKDTVNGITWYFHIEDGVAEIWNEGAAAVEGNGAILSLALPQTLGGYVVKGVGNGALSNLRGIESINIPSTYEWIGDFAFSNCTSLASVTIPEGVREIGHWPFYGTAITELSIPDSVSAINGNPVAGAALMKEIKVSDGQPYFATEDGLLYDKGQSTLLACPATKSSISLPDSVEEIADDAFYGCSLLDYGTEVIDGVTWHFNFTVNGAVVTAVEGATGDVVIPKALGGRPVVAIEPTALNGCSGITGFEVEPGNTAFVAKNGALYSADGKTLIRVPDTYLLPAAIVETRTESSVSETIIPRINPDGTDGTTTTRSVTPATTTTRTTQIEPTMPMELLLDGVAQIADFAFFGCGAGFEPSETIQTNDLRSTTGFIADTVFVRTTYTCATVSQTKESVITISDDVAYGPDAFTGSGATKVGPYLPPPSPVPPSPVPPSPVPPSPVPPSIDESSTYFGWISQNGIISGSVTFKTAKMRKGVIKISGSMQMLGEKKKSIKSLEEVKQNGGELTLAKDVSKTGAFDRFKGKVVTLALGTCNNGGLPLMNGYSTITVTIAAKGKAKVSGYLADGTKVNVSAQLVKLDDRILLPVVAPLYTGKKGGLAFVLDLSGDTAKVTELSELIAIADRRIYVATLAVAAIGSPADSINQTVIDYLEADIPVGYAIFPEQMKWKPRYTAKSGLIKGSLTSFKDTKKVKASVYGVSIDGAEYGTAVIKKIGSWPVFLH